MDKRLGYGRIVALALIVVAASYWMRIGDALIGATAAPPMPAPAGSQVAIFAGGCFWSMEKAFDAVPGVLSTTSGFDGGTMKNPTYEDVSYGDTGHAEAVRVVFDPAMVTYDRLLYVYWRNIDPLTRDAQFCDSGHQYRTAIFYLNDEQKRLATASKAALERSGRFKQPIVTEIAKAGPFYAAEARHQDFHRTNPLRYNNYRENCGRDAQLDEIWGKEARGGIH